MRRWTVTPAVVLVVLLTSVPAGATAGEVSGAGNAVFFAPGQAPALSSLANAEIVGERHTRGEASPAVVVDSAAHLPQAPSLMRPMANCYYNTPLNGAAIGGVWNCYAGWSGSSASANWEQTLRGVVRIDNRDNPQGSTLKYTQAHSGTATISITGTVAAGGEAQVNTPIVTFASAKLSGTMTVAASGSYSWTNSTTIEDTWTIPAYRVGYTYSYNAGGNVNGTVFYDIYDAGDGRYYGRESWGAGGTPPSQGAYNYRHVVANS